MRAATILGEIVRLQQCNKNPLKYVHAISKYGNIFAMPDSSTQETFFQDLQETKAGRIKFCSIFQLEMRNIRWPWNNTCQSIFSRNMNMNKFLLLVMGASAHSPRQRKNVHTDGQTVYLQDKTTQTPPLANLLL